MAIKVEEKSFHKKSNLSENFAGETFQMKYKGEINKFPRDEKSGKQFIKFSDQKIFALLCIGSSWLKR